MTKPQMPSLNGLPSSPSADASVNSEASVGLDFPDHQENEKPQILTPDSQNSSRVSAPIIPNKGIEVVATRKGFYNQTRINEGDKLFVKKFEQLGDWMRCTDPAIEKKRQEKFKKAK